jgi:hypothetical protein
MVPVDDLERGLFIPLAKNDGAIVRGFNPTAAIYGRPRALYLAPAADLIEMVQQISWVVVDTIGAGPLKFVCSIASR